MKQTPEEAQVIKKRLYANYDLALRAYEQAHKVYMDTPIWDEKAPKVRAELHRTSQELGVARAEYMQHQTKMEEQ